jgi:uncharacterized membrane protein YkvA (DUF1232 family)
MSKNIIVIVIGLLSILYLFNPGAGVFELIPDNIPGIGNLDEATAVVLLIACFRYFGIDISNLFRRKDQKGINKE